MSWEGSIPDVTKVKNALKNSWCALSKYSGMLCLLENLRWRTDGPFAVILIFHRVSDDVPEDDLTVSTVRFERICRLLSRTFRVVSLSDVFRMVGSSEPLPPRTVALTFDDGYQDNLFAARKLAEYGLPACFFVTAGFMETERMFDWDKGGKQLPNLTWDEVREIKRMDFEIGSHSLNHLNLGVISRSRVLHELIESKRIIEAEIGDRVRYFAYPFGGEDHFPEGGLALVQEAGYEGCLSGYGGFVYRGTNPGMLPREAVAASNMLHLEARLRGGLAWFDALKQQFPLLKDRAASRKIMSVPCRNLEENVV